MAAPDREKVTERGLDGNFEERWVVEKKKGHVLIEGRGLFKMERETGFEPATLALARQCSTTELFPPELRNVHESSVSE